MANEAGRLTEKAADLLHKTLNPGNELLPARRNELPGNFVDDMEEAVRLLHEAEDLLDLGLGQPGTEEGIAKLREASSRLGDTGIVFMPTDVTEARGLARNLIARAERAARQGSK